jgi:hypothetical protein
MPAFGYSSRVVNEYELHQLSEVTFDMSVANLRRIGTFLSECADRAESGEWRSSHAHIPAPWNECDIIVSNPRPDPPLHVE